MFHMFSALTGCATVFMARLLTQLQGLPPAISLLLFGTVLLFMAPPVNPVK